LIFINWHQKSPGQYKIQNTFKSSLDIREAVNRRSQHGSSYILAKMAKVNAIKRRWIIANNARVNNINNQLQPMAKALAEFVGELFIFLGSTDPG